MESSNKLNENWMDSALCKDEPRETFFPVNSAGVIAAKKICDICVVKEECLEYAIDEGIVHGVWGGTSERQRRQIKKVRNAGGEVI
jgi:WhiB family transcriptional regulator, redox-sensing transcriptional regulator